MRWGRSAGYKTQCAKPVGRSSRPNSNAGGPPAFGSCRHGQDHHRVREFVHGGPVRSRLGLGSRVGDLLAGLSDCQRRDATPAPGVAGQRVLSLPRLCRGIHCLAYLTTISSRYAPRGAGSTRSSRHRLLRGRSTCAGAIRGLRVKPGRRDRERALRDAWRDQAGAITPRLDRPPGGCGRVQHGPGVAEIAAGHRLDKLQVNAQALACVDGRRDGRYHYVRRPHARASPAPAWPTRLAAGRDGGVC